MDAIDKSPLIRRWASFIDPSIQVENISVQTADMFGPRLGMVEMDVFYKTREIQHQERVILTGRSSMIIPLLQESETGKLYTVLVRQPRIGSGRLLYEFPAGMADDSTDFRAVAARELYEEIGMKCDPEELIYASGIYRPKDPYTFLNAEHYEMGCHIFVARRSMPLSDILAYDGRSGGISADEQIELKVIPFDDVVFYAQEPATLGTLYIVSELLENGVL